jgi:hypothetical protein
VHKRFAYSAGQKHMSHNVRLIIAYRRLTGVSSDVIASVCIINMLEFGQEGTWDTRRF